MSRQPKRRSAPAEMPEYRGLLAEGRSLLGGTSESPFLDAALILAHAAGIPVDRIYAGGSEPVPEPVAERFRVLLRRRAAGEPVAWITGIREFFGHSFRVDPGVLVPRPDTETLVEAAITALPVSGTVSIHDAFTGSGAVGISLATAARERGLRVKLLLSDREPEARACAAWNAAALLAGANQPELDWAVEQSDGLIPASAAAFGTVHRFEIVTANPPYLTSSEWKARRDSGWLEPESSLDGGPDGLNAYRVIAEQARDSLVTGGNLFLELGEGQAEAVSGFLREAGLGIDGTHRDLAGTARVVHAIRTTG